MKNLFLTMVSTLIFLGCEKNDDPNNEEYPNCLQFEIDNVLKEKPTTIRANLKKYKYQNIIVYAFFEGNIIEGQTRVYNNECTKICEFGGIDGNQEGSCDNWENAELIGTIWADNR